MWKFNNSLISNTDFVEQMKWLIENIKQEQLLESEETETQGELWIGKKTKKKIESNLNSEANFNEYTK